LPIDEGLGHIVDQAEHDDVEKDNEGQLPTSPSPQGPYELTFPI